MHSRILLKEYYITPLNSQYSILPEFRRHVPIRYAVETTLSRIHERRDLSRKKRRKCNP